VVPIVLLELDRKRGGADLVGEGQGFWPSPTGAIDREIVYGVHILPAYALF
jgi:hypothetical protein